MRYMRYYYFYFNRW